MNDLRELAFTVWDVLCNEPRAFQVRLRNSSNHAKFFHDEWTPDVIEVEWLLWATETYLTVEIFLYFKPNALVAQHEQHNYTVGGKTYKLDAPRREIEYANPDFAPDAVPELIRGMIRDARKQRHAKLKARIAELRAPIKPIDWRTTNKVEATQRTRAALAKHRRGPWPGPHELWSYEYSDDVWAPLDWRDQEVELDEQDQREYE